MSDVPSRVATTRADLEKTLDAIEDKLNVPKRVGELTEKAKASYEKNPVPWIVGAVAVAAGVIGLIVWAASGGDD
jgi:hypothetical protein